MKIPERLALLAEMGGQEWRDSATCASVDPELWFPDKGCSGRQARRICRDVCPVRDECLAYALAADEPWGIWGGLSHPERLRLVGRRKPATTAPDHATEEAA